MWRTWSVELAAPDARDSLTSAHCQVVTLLRRIRLIRVLRSVVLPVERWGHPPVETTQGGSDVLVQESPLRRSSPRVPRRRPTAYPRRRVGARGRDRPWLRPQPGARGRGYGLAR